jgi:hypothetical protein
MTDNTITPGEFHQVWGLDGQVKEKSAYYSRMSPENTRTNDRTDVYGSNVFNSAALSVPAEKGRMLICPATVRTESTTTPAGMTKTE